MKTLFVLLAATMLQLSTSFADDGSKHVPDPDVVNHPPGTCWTCETKNNHQKYKVILAESREQAERVAIEHCVLGGGSKSLCTRNLRCALDNAHHPGEHPQDIEPYYDWGRGADGYGYCYLFDESGVLNEGKPVGNFMCNLSKTTYDYGTSKSGAQACVQWTPYGHIMNQGQPLDPMYCYKGKDFPNL